MYKANNMELQIHTEVTNKKKNVAIKVYKALKAVAFARLRYIFFNEFLLRDKEQSLQKYPKAAELFAEGGPKLSTLWYAALW